MVITLSKVAAIKFLTEEGVACEIEDEVSVYLKIHYSDLCKLYKVNCLIFIVRIENYIYIYIYILFELKTIYICIVFKSDNGNKAINLIKLTLVRVMNF